MYRLIKQYTDETPVSAYLIQDLYQKFMGKPLNFLFYSGLKDILELKDLLPATLLLYEPTSAKVGHFICFLETPIGPEVFDPLSLGLDREAGNGPKYLTNLIRKSPIKVIYNPRDLQSYNTDTCGMWCTCRLLSPDMTYKTFDNFFLRYSKNERDPLVAKIFNTLVNIVR